LLAGLARILGALRGGPDLQRGTALAKVHADIFRLSEDLDFHISVASTNPNARKAALAPVRSRLEEIAGRLRSLKIDGSLQGKWRSSHYGGGARYKSCLGGHEETIKIEISLREQHVEQPQAAHARTIMLDPHSAQPVVPAIEVTSMSLRETFAEKIRAALSRPTPAIRDLFDLDHAVRNRLIDPMDEALLDIARRKLALRGIRSPEVSQERLDLFQQQVETTLASVLREDDLRQFDFGRAIALLRSLYAAIR